MPSCTRNALGKVIDLAELYKFGPKDGNSSTGNPCDTYFAKAAYVPSSGPNADGELGKTKK